MQNSTRDKFGQLLMRHVRDQAIAVVFGAIAGKYTTGRLQHVSAKRLGVSPEVLQLVARTTVDEVLHDLLFACEGTELAMALREDGRLVDMAKESDGLSGEMNADEGWSIRFSRFPTDRQ